MRYESAVRFFGGSVQRLRLAFSQPVTHQAVYQWKKTGVIPKGKAFELEHLTSGKLRVRPDVYHNG